MTNTPKDSKWNEETQSGTYSDKIHHGEMKAGWDKNPVLSGNTPTKQTPLQQALVIFQQREQLASTHIEAAAYINVISILTSLLPAEKKLIEDAWKAGEAYGSAETRWNLGHGTQREHSEDTAIDLNEYMKQFNY